MKALVYRGPGKRSWEERPRPTLQHPTDAIVRVLETTICGTDLHILKGDLPSVAEGRILGHEAVGIVDEIGVSVSRFAVGDHVIVSCITSCGKCDACRRQMYSHCSEGGWALGHTIDGTQAEHVRIPFADTSLYAAPVGADREALLMLSDILPTGFECGVLNGKVQPGDTVVIVGAGPVGLATLLTAQLFSPAEIFVIDVDPHRLEVAQSLGATQCFDGRYGAAAKVRALTKNRGADVVIEAVGTPLTFMLCQDLVAAGGHIANVGVHGVPVQLDLGKLWDKNITITTRLVDTSTTAMLLKSVLSGRLMPKKLVTHRYPLDEMMKAYETFADAAEAKALKVVLRAG
jgi:alcohol dehydrogenase